MTSVTDLSQSVRRQVTLPRELVGQLEQIAASRGIGFSTLVRMLLYASLEKPA